MATPKRVTFKYFRAVGTKYERQQSYEVKQ